jgi:GTPase SAR1 family protein
MNAKPGGTAAVARNREIEQAMLRDNRHDIQRIKLLLLGAGESGKSTFFKQMRILNNSGFTTEEKKAILPNIHAAVVEAYQTVLENANKVKKKRQAEQIRTHDKDAGLNPELARAMQELWADPAIQDAWKRRSDYQVTDSLAWFVVHLDRLAASEYVPNEQDMLHVRVRTSGIIEEKFTLKGVEFNVFDVGGQRNERKKWIHCFENVTAVMFFVAISEYDQVLFEDQMTKRMDEALGLFDDICNSRFFLKTSMMLFLNKNDLFREKLANVPFR